MRDASNRLSSVAADGVSGETAEAVVPAGSGLSMHEPASPTPPRSPRMRDPRTGRGNA